MQAARGPYDEKELLLQVAAGSEAAFGELFNRFRPKLYTHIYRLTGSRETAEDTVHDVFLKIWTGREKLPEIDHFGAYLGRMARNSAYTGFQRMAKETLILAEIRRESAGGELVHPAEQLMAKEVRDFIRETVNRLTTRQRLIFIMSREEGLKYDEIARRLNISANTVKKHMADAIRYLREEIGKSYGPYAVAIYVLYQLTGR